MIFNISLLILGASLVSWQLWSDWKKSYILGFLSIGALALSAYILLVQPGNTIKNIGFIIISFLSISILSFIASKVRSYIFLRVPYLITSVYLIYLLIGSLNFNKEILPKNISTNGEILVKVKHNQIDGFKAFTTELKQVSVEHAFTITNKEATELDDYLVLDILAQNPKDIQKIISVIQKRPEVLYVEFNENIEIPEISTDYTKSEAKNYYLYDDPLNSDQWSLEKTSMNDLYKILKNKSPNYKARLFILDTGIDGNHEDLKEIFKATSAKNDQDSQGHGTHCAGIAGAMTGNSIGISSFNADALFEVSSIKVLSNFGGGTQQTIIQGIISAVEQGADVINLSLGGRSTDKSQKAYNEAIQLATNNNVIVVVAAGNSASDAKFYSPANAKGVIAVGAIDQNLNRANFSNSLENLEMGISAPGVDILSCFPSNKYQKNSGTSMAAPYISGLLTLMRCYNPNLTTSEAFEILNESGIQSFNNEVKTIVNPSAALHKVTN